VFSLPSSRIAGQSSLLNWFVVSIAVGFWLSVGCYSSIAIPLPGLAGVAPAPLPPPAAAAEGAAPTPPCTPKPAAIIDGVAVAMPEAAREARKAWVDCAVAAGTPATATRPAAAAAAAAD
jgi:hypothetical protein